MGMLKEFKEFAVKGNVLDLAVGVVIGAAFGKIVASAVSDVLMPPIGMLVGGVNFTDIKVQLKEASMDAAGKAVPAVTLNLGNFIQAVVDFTIVAFAVFLVVKGANALRNRLAAAEAAAPAEPSAEVKLLTEIRDQLKNR
jgi:large conductance mechanosensitive channel